MKFGVLLLISFHVVIVASQTDKTRQDGSYGSDVVEGVVSLLRDACIYPDSNLFLRRLAYAESQDGVNPKTYRQGYDGGIWQVDRASFDITKSKIQPELHDNIRNKLGIDWSNVTWSDLRKPMYSGLAAAIYLMTKGAPGNVPSSITDQATYWITNYRTTEFAPTFVNLAKELEVGCSKDKKMDLLFLLDTSGPIFNADHTKAFVKNFINSVDIGRNSVQVAVESFGSFPHVDIHLGTFNDKQSLLAAVDGTPLARGSPDLLGALMMASNDVFGSSSSVRSNVAKIIILVSSAKMSLTQPALIESFKIKNKGVTIYTVGTGLSNDALHQLASAPSCSHSYTVTDYTSLETLHPYVAQTSCRVAVGLQVGEYTYPCGSNVLVRVQSSSVGTSVKVAVDNGAVDVYGSYTNSQPSKDINNVNKTVSPSQPASFYIRDKRPLTLAVDSEHLHLVSCYGNIRITVEPSVSKRSECQNRKPDIVLLLDSSISKSQDDFKKMLDFSSRFANQFKIGADAAQIGLVTYAEHPLNQFWLKTYKRQEDIQSSIRSIPMFGSKPNLASALKFVREQAFTPSYGERAGSSQILVLVTGSTAQNQLPVVQEGQLLKNQGVRFVVVAVGSASTDPTLRQLAAGNEHYQGLQSYAELPGAVTKAVVESCGDVQLVCMENGLQRNCRIEDLLTSRFGPLIVPDHGAIPNSPCSVTLPVALPIHKFPHPTDKDRFILCDNKGQTYLVLCPMGEVYNGNTEDCELTSTTPTLTTAVLKQTTSGLLPAKATRPPPTHQPPITPITLPPAYLPIGIPKTGSPCSGDSLSRGLYFFPYKDPHKYIHCMGMPNASKLEDCPPLKIWRQASLQCEFEFITDKDGRALPSLHNPCVHSQPALFPHPTDKAAYIQCDAFGEGFLMRCPAGTEYRQSKQACCNVSP